MAGTTPAKNDLSTRNPHFFKVLFGDFAHRLKIPPKFALNIPEEASEVTLHDAEGKVWRIGLNRTINGVFLSSGWSDFVDGHSLKECEFLVFRHEENMNFSVIIFDTTACEKDREATEICEGISRQGIPVKRSLDFGSLSQKSEIEVELDKLPQEGRSVLCPELSSHPKAKAAEDGSTISMLNSKAKCMNRAGRSVLSPKLSGHRKTKAAKDGLAIGMLDSKAKFMNHAGKSVLSPKLSGRRKTKAAKDGLAIGMLDSKAKCMNHAGKSVISPKLGCNPKTEAVEDGSVIVMLDSKAKYMKDCFSRRQQVPEQQISEGEKAAYSFCSELPYFVARMNTSCIHKSFTLRVPLSFSQVNLPRTKIRLVLRDPTGKAWVVVFIPRTSQISGGWSAFIRGNKLELDCYHGLLNEKITYTP